VRVPDLSAFRQSIATLAAEELTPVVVVPSRSAARQLVGTGVQVTAVTRDELYDQFHARLPHPPRRLTTLERTVIAGAAARSAANATQVALRLRPGLVAEIVRFYDQLRRQSQSISRFEELIDEALGSDEVDRGAYRLRQQTRFLVEAFREYDRRVRQSDACDEHVLRERVISDAANEPVRHVIVTLADWIADADGLFVADFDLLSRVPGLETIDIIATERILGSGFHERVHSWWPGIEEVAGPSPGQRRPVLLAPPRSASDEPWWAARDREEELISVARRLKADRRFGESASLTQSAVVFKRPLPYLYLAREVFPAARVPFQTFDGFPLATEPIVAALDLILEAVSSAFTRETLVTLLRSPHLRFMADDAEPPRTSIAALDRALCDERYLGDPGRLATLAEEWERSSSPLKRAALPALRAARGLASELSPFALVATASEHIRKLSAFWDRHLRPLDAADGLVERETRVRAAVSETLTTLADACAAYDDPQWKVDDLALAVRRAIEDQTFDEEPHGQGLVLLDDKAVRYRPFDDITVVGIVENDWPERPRRNIFYPASLLKALGWPSERDRRAAADAHFLDLISAASRRTVLSTFTLDDDSLVSRSLQLDDVGRARLSVVEAVDGGFTRMFEDEALSLDPVAIEMLGPAAKDWVALRATRTPGDADRFHGLVPDVPDRVWSVSALETYLGCPFRFFAQHVLKLEEEPDDEEIMNPRRQGQFIHEVFERFFTAWQAAGHGAITDGNLDEARRVFAQVVADALARLPAAEAGLERTRLLGSPAAAGLGEAVLRMEAERPTPVVWRLLEHDLSGTFSFATSSGARPVAIRGKADRIDLLADGTFRLIDYKLGWPPKDRRKALQLPIYGLCAAQQLQATRGGDWTLGEAAYLAFKGPRRVVPLFQNGAERDRLLADAQDRLASTIDSISAGHFPPTPDDVYRCESCGYAGVCRKDYVGDV
jgi:RecB family exonuclease